MSRDLRTLLGGAPSLLVGLSLADNLPFATRGWGFDRDQVDPNRGRLLMSESDLTRLGFGAGSSPGLAVAITGMEVDTLEAVQAKGRLVEVLAPTLADQVRKDRYCDELIAKIVGSGWYEQELIERWRPGQVLPCVVELEEYYNQHPGVRDGEGRGRLDGGEDG